MHRQLSANISSLNGKLNDKCLSINKVLLHFIPINSVLCQVVIDEEDRVKHSQSVNEEPGVILHEPDNSSRETTTRT